MAAGNVPDPGADADDAASAADAFARVTHVRCRTIPEEQDVPGSSDAPDGQDPPTVPAVSGDDCVRALLACGCKVEALQGRAWALSCESRRILVPRHKVLDVEILVDILRGANVALDRFRRTLERLDLLRGDAEPSRRPVAYSTPSTAICEPDNHQTAVSGDELAEVLAVFGWLVWERGPLVTRLARRGQMLVVPRAQALDLALVRYILRRGMRQG